MRGIPIFDWLIKVFHAYYLAKPVPALEPGE
jgi:hypothetical protein